MNLSLPASGILNQARLKQQLSNHKHKNIHCHCNAVGEYKPLKPHAVARINQIQQIRAGNDQPADDTPEQQQNN